MAERFELYVRGVELANGYHELLDPAVLRARNHTNNVARAADGKEELPEESRLLAAMDAGLPAATGVALGFDRVVMLAAGEKYRGGDRLPVRPRVKSRKAIAPGRHGGTERGE